MTHLAFDFNYVFGNGSALSSLEKEILKTVSFYDIFDYPLTGNEIFNNLFQPTQNFSYLDIIKNLDIIVENIIFRRYVSLMTLMC